MTKFKDKIFIEECRHTDDVNKYIYFSDMFLGLLKFNKRTFKIEYMKVIFKEGYLINNRTNNYIQNFISHTLKHDFLEHRAYSVNYKIMLDVAIYKHCDNKIIDLFEPIKHEPYSYNHWVDIAKEFIETNRCNSTTT